MNHQQCNIFFIHGIGMSQSECVVISNNDNKCKRANVKRYQWITLNYGIYTIIFAAVSFCAVCKGKKIENTRKKG
jgi:hypothetical protein